MTRRLKVQVEDEDDGWPAMILTSVNRLSLACWGQLLSSHYTRPPVPHRAQCDVLNGGSPCECSPGAVRNDALFRLPPVRPLKIQRNGRDNKLKMHRSSMARTTLNSCTLKYPHFPAPVSTC